MTELKPCPFCGSSGKLEYIEMAGGWVAGCSNDNCAGGGRLSGNKEKTVQFWNFRTIPEGYKLVPIEPTQDQFGGMARDIIQWLRFTGSGEQNPTSLKKWLTSMGHDLPEWLLNETEMKSMLHVISKGTIAAIIYKAMCSDAPKVGE